MTTPPHDHANHTSFGSLATRSSLTGLITSLNAISSTNPSPAEDFLAPSVSPRTSATDAQVAVDVFDSVTEPLLIDDEPSISEPSSTPWLGQDTTRPVGASAMGTASFLKRSGAMPHTVPSANSLERAASAASTTAKEKAHDVGIAAVYGLINSIVTIPVILSFASIIFQHPLYQPVLGPLVKLVFLSCALHQLIFVIFSTLPFAVGQVGGL